MSTTTTNNDANSTVNTGTGAVALPAQAGDQARGRTTGNPATTGNAATTGDPAAEARAAALLVAAQAWTWHTFRHRVT
ncbi:hypothetical protein I3W98_06965, partial [Streptomyces cavourensis]|nr:hypothetical protein [Streptomyces cavourensis]